MPKMKSRSAAKKRFRSTGGGAFKHKKAFKSHILTKKGSKRRRRLGRGAHTNDMQTKKMEKMVLS